MVDPPKSTPQRFNPVVEVVERAAVIDDLIRPGRPDIDGRLAIHTLLDIGRRLSASDGPISSHRSSSGHEHLDPGAFGVERNRNFDDHVAPSGAEIDDASDDLRVCHAFELCKLVRVREHDRSEPRAVDPPVDHYLGPSVGDGEGNRTARLEHRMSDSIRVYDGGPQKREATTRGALSRPYPASEQDTHTLSGITRIVHHAATVTRT